MSTVYVVTNAEPDVEVDSVWESFDEANARRDELHNRWPGVGYYVLSNVPFHASKDGGVGVE